MKLWLISQTVNNDYDTYDSAVVAATTKQAAQMIHPNGESNDWWTDKNRFDGNWAMELSQVKVEYIGQARRGVSAGVIVASYRAG